MLFVMLLWMLLAPPSCITAAAQEVVPSDDGGCSPVYSAIDAPLQYLELEKPLDWEVIQKVCAKRFPGYHMLAHRYAWLTDEEVARCDPSVNPEVPLGIYRHEKQFYWRNIDNNDEEIVYPDDLARKGSDNSIGYSIVYNLVNKTWYSIPEVSPGTSFKFAICERDHRSNLKHAVSSTFKCRRDHNDTLFLATVQVPGTNQTRRDIYSLAYNIESAFNIEIYIRSLHHNTTVNNVTQADINVCLRQENTTTPQVDPAEYLKQAFNGSWTFKEVTRADICREERLTSVLAGETWTFDWPETNQDQTASFPLDSDGVEWASRDCIYNESTGRSQWGKVENWYYLPAKCWREKEAKLNKEIDKFNESLSLGLTNSTLLGYSVELSKLAYTLSKIDFKYQKNHILSRFQFFKAIKSLFDQGLIAVSDIFKIESSYSGVRVREPLPLVVARYGSTPNKYDEVLRTGFHMDLFDDFGSNDNDYKDYDYYEEYNDKNPSIQIFTERSLPNFQNYPLKFTLWKSFALFSPSLKYNNGFSVLSFYTSTFLFPFPKNVLLTKDSNKTTYLISVRTDGEKKMFSSNEWYIDVYNYNTGSSNDDKSLYKRMWAVHNILSDFTTEVCVMMSSNHSVDLFRCPLFTVDSNIISGTYVEYYDFELSNVSQIENALFLLNRYAQQETVSPSQFDIIGVIVDRIIDLTYFRIINVSEGTVFKVLKSLETIIGKFEQIPNCEYLNFYRRAFSLLVTDVTSCNNAIVGYSLVSVQNKYLCVYRSIEPIWSNISSNIYRSSDIAVVLSKELVSTSSRLGFSTFNEVYSLFPNSSIKLHEFEIETAFQIILITKTDKLVSIDENMFIDVYVNKIVVWGSKDRLEDDDLGFKIGCAFLNNNSLNDGTLHYCSKLKSTRGSKEVFRCRSLTQHSNILRGTYVIFRYYSKEKLNNFLNENITLYVIFIIVCILSLLGILIILFTVILTKSWRHDKGLKVLLFMAMSVILNLLLGFVHNFNRVDSRSKACIVTGALRHYSYLSMFCWMSILSVLQLFRILTLNGLKNTSRLLVKVSLVAWGIPLVIVSVLLLADHKAYLSEVKDRGFCYPEGTNFKLTVQAPAGFILVSNMIIFLVTFARANECLGWGKKDELQRHTNEHNLQKGRNRYFFYSFLMFGFQWTFHFFSEEGLINNELVYEYLFLITASLHIFLLALIFVLIAKAGEEFKEIFMKIWSRATSKIV